MAGPVPAIVWPLTLAALLITAKSETSTVAAMAMLKNVRLWFIRFAFLDILQKERSKEVNENPLHVPFTTPVAPVSAPADRAHRAHVLTVAPFSRDHRADR
jgi:hypothetical protein